MTTGVKIVLICLAFAVIIFIMEILRSRYVLGVNRKNVSLAALPEAFSGTKIVLISDLHQIRFGEYNVELAKRIKREKPDYILFAGDMGDSMKFNVDAFYELMESLGSDIPLIMVPGNHDLRLGGGDVHKNFAREVESAGAVLLNNTCAELAKGGKKLYIYGFCQPLDPQEGVPAKRWNFSQPGKEELRSLIGICPDDAPVILLAHDPQPFEVYSEWGADLVLAGHMHGGQVRLPVLGGVFAPEKKFFPKYTAGLYNNGESKMFVTRGLGSTWAPRFLNAPEICVLTLLTPEAAEEEQARKEAEKRSRKPLDMLRLEPAAANAEKAPRDKITIDDIKQKIKDAGEWVAAEWRSLRDLLGERLNQLGDFFNLLFGKKRSRFSIAADEKKMKNTYIAPRNRRTHMKREPDLLEKSAELAEKMLSKSEHSAETQTPASEDSSTESEQ